MNRLLVFTIIWFTIKLSVTVQKERVYCVLSTYQNVNVTGTKVIDCSSFISWTSILLNTSRYFVSNTKLYFLPGTYELDEHLQLTNIINFSITGDKEEFTIIMCPANTSNVSLSISNSSLVELNNIKFKNCKMTIQQINFTAGGSLLSTGTSAAVFVYNVTTLKIANVSFENCNCHGIVGFNMLGSTSLLNISIFQRDIQRDEKVAISIGGFILVYFDDVVQNHNYKMIQEVHIDGCAIFNIRSTTSSNRSKISNELHSSVIGIGLYQQRYSVKVKLLNIIISNVKFNKGPIIMIVYNSKLDSVGILNSNFSKIVNKQQPIISILTMPSEANNPSAEFTLAHCKFTFSTALSILYVSQQPVKDVGIKFNITVCYTEFKHNKAGEDFWKMKVSKRHQAYVSIVNSNFIFNLGFTLWFFGIDKVLFVGTNKFYNNSVKDSLKAIIRCNGTILRFEGYNEFAYNTANTIISLVEKHIGLNDNTIISFLHNKALTTESISSPRSVIKFKMTKTFYNCLFQFFSKSGNLDKQFIDNNAVMYFNVTFEGNKDYRSTIYGTQLNSCYWDFRSAFKKLTPGVVYKRLLHFNVTSEKITKRQGVSFCYCDSTGHVDCIIDQFGPIYPGQNIPISLKHSVLSNMTSNYKVPLMHRYFTFTRTSYNRPQCELVPLYNAKFLVQVINHQCTALLYTVLNYHNSTSCLAQFSEANSRYSIYYSIDFKTTCPLGFETYNGSCECNKQLKTAMPSLTCDIKTQSITTAGSSWVGLSSNKQKVLYVTICHTFCSKWPTTIRIEYPDAQCKDNRTGIMCGQCPPGLDAIFGSFRCKKCSNYWLLLTPVFMLAGILLVLSLFVLNLTVVDGKINGFVLYTNLITGNSYNVFPSKRKLSFILMSLFNLDLGVETCFYHGMTEYAKTWLQFVFPMYLLLIVAILVVASRYSSSVEKLTRRRVIPVIATIFLLSYNKLLLTTVKVLCSYRTIHSLPDNETMIIWIWDSTIPILSIKFLVLLIVCLLVFFILIMPFNLLLLFTKFSYRLKFVAEYLKPYLDAYQAPFKNNCYYYFGVELLLRPIAFAIGNRILDSYKTLAIVTLLCVLLLLYTSIVKPFKSKINTFLYVSYLFNSTCLVLLVAYFNFKLKSVSYEIVHDCLILIAFIQFGSTVFYYLYINHLHKVRQLEKCFKKAGICLLRCWNKCAYSKNKIASNPLPLEDYVQLQEELLMIDPNH